MSYTSYEYLFVFLVAVFLIYIIVPKKFKWVVLLLGSYLFYFINSRLSIVFILITTLSVYIAGLSMNKIQDAYELAKPNMERPDRKKYKALMQWQKRAIVILIVILNFGLLVFLKYWNFIGTSINDLMHLLRVSNSLPIFKMVLPLGISFYTLQAVSYVIDVYRGKYRASHNLGKVALFMSFFPQIVEGPIGRFDLLADKLYEGHSFDYKNFTYGIQLIVWGMFKKIVIADRANMFVNTVFDKYGDYSGVTIIAAAIIYTLQLYADFSGCIDIVTGSAQLFGVPLSKNFERPFFSGSVSEFWRRWHMTLGSWFRDYVFYPVSLSAPFMRLSKNSKKYFGAFLGTLIPASVAMFTVWFGTGLWHGASWKYVAYGLYYFLIMFLGMLFEPVFNKVCTVMHINRKGRIFGAFRIIRTCIFVVIGMMMFRATRFLAFIDMFKSMFSGTGFSEFGSIVFTLGLDKYDFILLGIGFLALLVVGIIQERGHEIRIAIAERNIVLRWAIYIVLLFSVIIFGAYGGTYAPVDFIYAQF